MICKVGEIEISLEQEREGDRELQTLEKGMLEIVILEESKTRE